MSSVWYHLSLESNWKVIANSSSVRNDAIKPRIPEDSYQEPQEILRVCVAPRVWQCLRSIPRDGTLHIYKIETSMVINANDIADGHISGENWITDEQLESEIPLEYMGFVFKDTDLLNNLRFYSTPGTSRDGRLSENPDSTYWRIDNGEWIFDDSNLG